MRNKLLVILSVLMVLSMLAACTPVAPAPAPPAAEQPAEPAAAPEEAAAAPAAKLVYGDLPRNEAYIVGHQVPSSDIWDAFNPFAPNNNNASGFFQVAIELPFYRDDNTNLFPFLAKSWEYSEDGKTFTLNIVDSANWNDGTPLTVDDWIFTVNYYIENMATIAGGVGLERSVDNVKAEGTDKLVFTLKEPDFNFHQQFINGFYVLPKHIWEGEDPTEFTNPNAVFSGPYKLVSTNNETRVVIWERRDVLEPGRCRRPGIWSGRRRRSRICPRLSGSRATMIWAVSRMRRSRPRCGPMGIATRAWGWTLARAEPPSTTPSSPWMIRLSGMP